LGSVRYSLPLLVLTIAATTSAVSQANLNIQNKKPETPVLNLPYTADYDVRSVQHLADGTTIVRHISGHAVRSSAGIERLEGTLVPSTPGSNTPTTQIWILDRTQHTAILLNTKLKTATLTRLPPDATATVGFLPATPGQTPAQNLAKPQDMTTDNLEPRTQDGIALVGRRVTGTIPAGAIGNEEPFQVTTETWFSPQLRLMVSRIEHDPRIGERTVAFTNIHTEEPDPTLFQVPPDYKLTEQHTAIPPTPIPIKPTN
jgi:hypothetical protein